jgi:hypothetical protein
MDIDAHPALASAKGKLKESLFYKTALCPQKK